MKILLLILLFALPAFTQEIKSHYDKFNDVTTVSYKDKIVFTDFSVFYQHPGTKRSGETYWIGFSRNVSPRHSFDRRTSLIFVADGERMVFDSPRYSLDHNAIGGLDERLYFATSEEDLLKLVNAKEVEFRVDDITAKLSEKRKKGIKELLAK